MRALQKLSKKIMNCILVLSLFLGTGITTVFANEEINYDTLIKSVDNLNASIDSLSNITIGNTDIKTSVDNVVASLDDIKNGIIPVSANSLNQIRHDKIVKLDINTQTIIYETEINIEENKSIFNKGAQELTTTYKTTVDQITELVLKINKANELDTTIDTLNTDVINTLNFVSEKIAENELYETKVSELNTLTENLIDYSSKIDSNTLRYNLEKLKVSAENLDSIYDNADLDALLNNISNELGENPIREKNYETYSENYNKILNEYINNSIDAIIEELLNTDSDNVDSLVRKLNDLSNYDTNSNEKFNDKIEAKLNELVVPTNEDERLAGLNIINKLNLLNNEYNDDNKNLLNEKLGLYNKSYEANITYLEIHGYEFNKQELESENMSLSVSYEVENVEYKIEVSDKASYQITGYENLQVGENTVTINVTAENGNVKTYTVIINRLEKYTDLGDVKEDNTNTNTEVLPTNNEEIKEENTTVTTLANNSSSKSTISEAVEQTEDEKSNTSDSKDKYNEELEEEKLSPLTVLLVITGIALVGFGIYMLFGKDEEDDIKIAPKKEEKIEIKKVEVKNTKNKNNSKNTKSSNSKKSNKKSKK